MAEVYQPCGGCGADHPSKRCINCFHDFGGERPDHQNKEGLESLVDQLLNIVAAFDLDRQVDLANAEETGERPDLWPEEVDVPVALLSKAADALSSLREENERLRKERDVAYADAYKSSLEVLDRQADLDKANERAAKNWRDFRDLRLDITGHGPMCRDCADFDGRCQGNGRPCDPDEAVKEQIAEWRASQAQLKIYREALEEVSKGIGSVRWMDPPDGGNVSLGEQVRRMRIDLETAERWRDSLREALTPSGDTKAAYSGEFHERIEVANPMHEGNEDDEPETIAQTVIVSWVTIKEVMAAIRARAADLQS